MFKLIAASLLVAGSAAAIGVSTPSPTIKQCEDLTFTITDANAPAFFAIVNSANPCDSDAIFETTSAITGTTYTWKVTADVGTSFTAVVDTGDDTTEAYSGPITVVEGDSTACLTASTGDDNAEDDNVDIKENPVSSVPKPSTTPNDGDDETPINAGTDGDVGAADTGAAGALGVSTTFAALVAGLVAWNL